MSPNKITLHTASGEAVECEIPSDCPYFERCESGWQFVYNGGPGEPDFVQSLQTYPRALPIIAAVAAEFWHEKAYADGVSNNDYHHAWTEERNWRKLTAKPLTAKPEAKK